MNNVNFYTQTTIFLKPYLGIRFWPDENMFLQLLHTTGTNPFARDQYFGHSYSSVFWQQVCCLISIEPDENS